VSAGPVLRWWFPKKLFRANVQPAFARN